MNHNISSQIKIMPSIYSIKTTENKDEIIMWF